MSISQALNTSLSGLRATQAGLSLVGSNVANAQTPGYVRKTLVVAASAAGDAGSSVRVIAVNRELDQYLQRQLRVESAGGAYADLRAEFYSRLQNIYGDPSSSSSLETVFNNFTGSVQSLATSRIRPPREAWFSATRRCWRRREPAPAPTSSRFGPPPRAACPMRLPPPNEAMQQIAKLNTQLSGKDVLTAGDAVLADQRDLLHQSAFQMMDIRVVTDSQKPTQRVHEFGRSTDRRGAATLSFTRKARCRRPTLWNADPAKSNLGSIRLV